MSDQEETKVEKSPFSISYGEGQTTATIMHNEEAFAHVVAGDSILKPTLKSVDDTKDTTEAEKWLGEYISNNLKSLVLMDGELNHSVAPEGDVSALEGDVKTIAANLLSQLGILNRTLVEDTLKKINTEDRKALWRFKTKIGASTIFIPFILKPEPTKLRLLLWALFEKQETLPPLPTPGMVWVDVDKDVSPDFYRLCGYRNAGKKAVRVDMVERLADAVRPQGLKGASFQVTPETMGLVGLSGDDFADVMKMIGYHSRKHSVAKEVAEEAAAKVEVSSDTKPEAKAEPELEEFYSFTWVGAKKPAPKKAKAKVNKKPKGKTAKKPAKKEFVMDPNSPFAALAGLKESMKKK